MIVADRALPALVSAMPHINACDVFEAAPCRIPGSHDSDRHRGAPRATSGPRRPRRTATRRRRAAARPGGGTHRPHGRGRHRRPGALTHGTWGAGLPGRAAASMAHDENNRLAEAIGRHPDRLAAFALRLTVDQPALEAVLAAAAGSAVGSAPLPGRPALLAASRGGGGGRGSALRAPGTPHRPAACAAPGPGRRLRPLPPPPDRGRPPGRDPSLCWHGPATACLQRRPGYSAPSRTMCESTCT